MGAMQPESHVVWSPDNVRLHFLTLGDRNAQPALLCLPGLTRNARDFLPLAQRLAPRFRLVLPSFRGRGESGNARDPLTYEPFTYLRDLALVIEAAGVGRFVVIGTSLGGLVGLLLGLSHKERIDGLVLNDFGPELESAGLQRIAAQLGRGGNWASWLQAARDIAQRQHGIYPDWTLDDWIAHAKRLCRLSPEGRVQWDYDAQIGVPLALGAAIGPADLWQALSGFADRPVLSIRGGLSDILSAGTQQRMAYHVPLLDAVEVPRVGHAPTLMEPQAQAALERWFERRLADR